MREPSESAKAAMSMVIGAYSRSVGDYIQPMVDCDGGMTRRNLLVTRRDVDVTGPFESVRYTAVDRFGSIFDVTPMDDPRRSNREQFEAEEPM